ncbi:LAGLIDADG family homing endonuclease [Iodidimonas sp. SYSU 1G8]|uniref:LAGLIDADG family homing endonuclease n=1 Tax=Iodidimonas sp. SYSU 1G8 TaxID=3133967 RepID=UPI0031FE4514
MTATAPISTQIWDMKYRLKAADGTAVDKSVDDTWWRIARALAEPEAADSRESWAARFHAALEGFKFLPAGRIVAGAGSGRDVTLFNCFVMGTIPDDMSGIFDNLREAALTMQKGGGIGYDFSTLRPKGARVKGVGADASGPLPFMDVWDAMCRTIMSAGHRRGAMMATMRCDHPDIEAFIAAKQDPGRLRMFNMSVLVTDAFVEAVRNDGTWDLVFDGTVYRTMAARALWDSIMRATYAYAEPGVIFIDRINQRNNLWYAETIAATNPCVTADTWVMTAGGPRQVSSLVGTPFDAVVDGKVWPSGEQGFFSTGRKAVLRLSTDSGHELRLTADHPVQVTVRLTRDVRETAWRKAGELQPGDRVVLHDHRAAPGWAGAYGEDEGYLMGLLVGDGTLKDDKAVLSAWPGSMVVCGSVERPGVLAVMDRALDAARRLPHRSDFRGWSAVAGRGERRLSSAAIKSLAESLGMAPGTKATTPQVETTSSGFHRGFLRALFDADGSVQGTHAKGVSVRLAQSDVETLRAVQRMLARFGIASRLYRDRRPAGPRLLPDGKGGKAAYECRADHELVIAGDNLSVFAERVGFEDTDKDARLRQSLSGYRRQLNKERFVAVVEAIEPNGDAEVFDVQVPGVNAFDANGLYVHNCGEQPLPPYGACLLGSVNLAMLVTDPFTPAAALDMDALDDLVTIAVRMMDNVVDTSRFPLEQQAHEARAKRRIGLGVTGLADALIMCRARYGAPEAIALIERWMARIQRAAYLASAALAAEKGAFPLFDAEKYLAGASVSEMDEDVREAIRTHGIRNALLTSIAPTGTISLFADNVSSGLEPVFSFTYTRKVLMPDGTRKEETVSDHAYRQYIRQFGENAVLPDYFVTAQTLQPRDHVRMQAAVQKYIDSSISKTINCPEDISFEAFKDVYMQAYEMGCKGCTTYRPNDVTGSVLEATPQADADEPRLPLEEPAPRHADEYAAGGVVYMTRPLDRPEALPGKTYKIKWADSDHAMYITLNDVVQDGRRRPFEIFINSKNMEHYAWTLGLTRMISAVFRRGGDVSFVVEELKAVFDPRGGQWMRGHYVPSLLAAIGEVIEAHLIDIGFIKAEQDFNPKAERLRLAVGDAEGRPAMRSCPKCGAPSLIRQEGCDTCISCGYSKCG